MAIQPQGVPSFNYSMVGKDGSPTPAWYAFFVNMWNRLGGAAPTSFVTSITVNTANGIASTTSNTNGAVTINLALNSQQVTSSLNIFTASSSGVVPASGGSALQALFADTSFKDVVTTISVDTANGFSGTVTTPSTTPILTLKTTVTGIVKGNGTALSAATAGTDYSDGTSGLATGVVYSTTGTGALSTINGIDATVVLAALTGGGTQGSATFTKGVLTAYTPPT